MFRYIPPFILDKFTNNIYTGNFQGYVLFFDIADFTSIGNEFRKHGKVGAEELSRFLEDVFETPIQLVEAYGGFVSLFAGDAFCAIFPHTKAENIYFVINSIEKYFHTHGVFNSACGNFNVKIRLTASMGQISWSIFKNDYQNEYVFYGNPLEEIAFLSAEKLLITLSDSVQTIFANLDKNYIPQPEFLKYNYADDAHLAFCHKKYRNINPDNEIRDGAYCFVDFSHIPPKNQQKVIALLHEKLDHYGGLLNKLDATDKGLLGLILFGLPKTEGNTLERICRFAMEISHDIPLLGLGLACGNVYAGFVGGKITREYTALGAAVNLSARLMSLAEKGQIITDTFLYRDLCHYYHFEDKGYLKLKGFVAPVKTFQLKSIKNDRQIGKSSKFVGRSDEIYKIQNMLKTDNNNIIYVSGDAGIGKSRLIIEALKDFNNKYYLKLFTFCDPVKQKLLEPIKKILLSLFPEDLNLTHLENLNIFRAKWQVIAGSDPELNRIESLIGYILGYEWENSVISYISLKERNEQLQMAFVTYMTLLTQKKTILLHLDDPQWIDAESIEYFNLLGHKIQTKFHIICACRFKEDGSLVNLELPGFKPESLHLGNLSETGSSALIFHLLNHNDIPQDTLDLIMTRSEGNPFFIEQLIAYLEENSQFDSDYNITGDITNINSFSIADIIGNRIDNLTENVRQTLQNASILGIEFNINLLSTMLQKQIESDLYNGKNCRIWSDLDELHYIFAHVLIKDITYQRMISSRLQELHSLAANMMEQVYQDKLDEVAEDIAMHYLKAKNKISAAKFYVVAGDYFREKFIFTRAESCFNLAQELYQKQENDYRKEIASIQNKIGLIKKDNCCYEEAHQIFKNVFELYKVIYGEEQSETLILMHNYAISCHDLGLNYLSEELHTKALDIVIRTHGEHSLNASDSMNHLAFIHYSLDKFQEAENLYLKCISIKEKELGPDHIQTADLYINLARLYHSTGKYDQAEDLMQKALISNIAEFGEFHPHIAVIYNAKAKLYMTIGKLPEAEELLLKALLIQEKILGLQNIETLCTYNLLSELYATQGKTQEGEAVALKVLEIIIKIHGFNHSNTAAALGNVGLSYYAQGKYPDAITKFKEAAEVNEKIGLGESAANATTLSNLGFLHSIMKDEETAEMFQLKSLKIKENLFEPDTNEIALSQNNLAQSYLNQKKYDQAEALFLSSLKIWTNLFGKNHPNTATSLLNTSKLFLLTDRFDLALEYANKALNLFETIFNLYHPRTLVSLELLGNIHEKMGNIDSANHYKKLWEERKTGNSS